MSRAALVLIPGRCDEVVTSEDCGLWRGNLSVVRPHNGLVPVTTGGLDEQNRRKTSA